MKKSLIAVGVVVASALAGIGIGRVVAEERISLVDSATSVISSAPSTATSPTATPTLPPTTTPTPTPSPGQPARFRIPSLSIDTAVEIVGLDSVGNMDVPKKSENVAWYKFGPKPGEAGNAAIAGHYDWTDGPAVFYDLHTITPGAEIIITDTAGQEQTFTVTTLEEYPYNNIPSQEVFGTHTDARLNLITCSGTFDKASQNYSHRVIVYAAKKV